MKGEKMGVTIESKNYSLDFGYGGFFNIRKKVAELTSPDVGEHYKKLENSVFLFGKRMDSFFEEYNKKITEISEKHNGKFDEILHFLYSSDCGAKMPYQVCEKIYAVIKDYDDNICYGYSGRPDCAMFKDFKNLVKDCVDNKCDMGWF